MSLLKQESVREGFLCPICVQDLGSFQKLQTHFEDVHSSEDKEVFKQLKGFFSKAKGKFFGQDENETPARSVEGSSSSQAPRREVGRIIWEPQELGHSRSQFESFKKLRDDRIDRFVVESNKVLIRLEKIVKLDEKETVKRKDFEKSLVYWVSDDDVPFCPTCGNRFGIAKRRHHCRLCGSIMCSKCSNFVTHEFADDLVTALQTLPGSTASQFSRPRARSVDTAVKNQGNHQNLMQTRICIECLKILSKRKERKDQKENQSILLQLYEKLQSSIQQANQLSPEYERMADSLNCGEDDYQLDQAQELRIRLVRFYEGIDVLSKKLVSLGQLEEYDCGPREARLISNIRKAAHAYLQENMLTLRSIPSFPKLEKLQMERRKEKELMRRREHERMERERTDARRQQEIERLKQEREAAEREKKMQQQQPTNNSVVKGGGWIANTTPSQNPFDNNNDSNQGDEDSGSDADSDPIFEQIGNVERMLRQAESVGMHAEANSLRQNLSELRAEHKRVNVSRAFGGFGASSQQQTRQQQQNQARQQQKQIRQQQAIQQPQRQQMHTRPATVVPTPPPTKQQSTTRTGRKNPFEIIAEKNPFLSNNSSPTKSPTKSTNQKRFLSPLRNRNPFVKPKNPFLDDDDDDDVEASDNTNPFVMSDDDEQGHVFRRGDQRKSTGSSTGGGEMKDPMLEQICYITKCLDEAVKIGKHDEAAMLRQNLKELQAAYQGNS